MIGQQKRQFLSSILNNTDMSESIPLLTNCKDGFRKFSSFLRVLFKQSTLSKINSGSNVEFKKCQEILRNLLKYCTGSADQKEFSTYFVREEIIRSGLNCIKAMKDAKDMDVMAYMKVEKNPNNYLNPFILPAVTKHLLEEDQEFLNEGNAIATLLNLLIMMALNLQGQAYKKLITKLLKQGILLVKYATDHCKVLAKNDQLKPIIQNKILKLVTDNINFSKTKFSGQQLMFLELHVMINALQEKAGKKYNAFCGKVLEDSDAVLGYVKNKRILQEREGFNLVKYLYHLKNLE